MAKEIDPKDSAKKALAKKKTASPKATPPKKASLPSKKAATNSEKKAVSSVTKTRTSKAPSTATTKKTTLSKKASGAKRAAKSGAPKAVKTSEKKTVPALKLLPDPAIADEEIKEINAVQETSQTIEAKAPHKAEKAPEAQAKPHEGTKAGPTPVTDAAKKAAERLGIDSDEVDKAAEKFRAQATAAQAKIVDALKLVSADLAVGARKIYELTENAAKNLGVDSTGLNEAIGKGMDEACDKAIDAAVTASAEFKRGLAGFRLKLEEMRAAAMNKKRTDLSEDTSEKSSHTTEEDRGEKPTDDA